jgi:hypothetical protein
MRGGILSDPESSCQKREVLQLPLPSDRRGAQGQRDPRSANARPKQGQKLSQVDHNRLNFSPDNLEVLLSQSEHAKKHALEGHGYRSNRKP